jgi:hypothetical protein
LPEQHLAQRAIDQLDVEPGRRPVDHDRRRRVRLAGSDSGGKRQATPGQRRGHGGDVVAPVPEVVGAARPRDLPQRPGNGLDQLDPVRALRAVREAERERRRTAFEHDRLFRLTLYVPGEAELPGHFGLRLLQVVHDDAGVVQVRVVGKQGRHGLLSF